MINKIDISAPQKSYKVSDDLEKYIMKKIGKLDRHMKRENRSDARADVRLKENTSKNSGAKKYTAEVVLHTSDYKLTATESTMNMHAAIDIVENKLQNQLKKHKEKHSIARDKRKNNGARRAFGRIFKKR